LDTTAETDVDRPPSGNKKGRLERGRENCYGRLHQKFSPRTLFEPQHSPDSPNNRLPASSTGRILVGQPVAGSLLPPVYAHQNRSFACRPVGREDLIHERRTYSPANGPFAKRSRMRAAQSKVAALGCGTARG